MNRIVKRCGFETWIGFVVCMLSCGGNRGQMCVCNEENVYACVREKRSKKRKRQIFQV